LEWFNPWEREYNEKGAGSFWKAPLRSLTEPSLLKKKIGFGSRITGLGPEEIDRDRRKKRRELEHMVLSPHTGRITESK